MAGSTDADRRVTLGKINGIYGVKGWVKVYSETDPREGILSYKSWQVRRGDGWQDFELESGRRQGKTLVAKLAGMDDRDQAAELIGCAIAVSRDCLSQRLEQGEFFWTDLEGLNVQTREGVELGKVQYLFETGSNDVLVIRGERERWLPFIWEQVVLEVNLDQGFMVVDWDPEF